jgi:hypothetical protein
MPRRSGLWGESIQKDYAEPCYCRQVTLVHLDMRKKPGLDWGLDSNLLPNHLLRQANR